MSFASMTNLRRIESPFPCIPINWNAEHTYTENVQPISPPTALAFLSTRTSNCGFFGVLLGYGHEFWTKYPSHYSYL